MITDTLADADAAQTEHARKMTVNRRHDLPGNASQ